MTSKNLFFKLMKEDLKQRLWSVILASIVFLIIPISMALELEKRYNYTDNARWQSICLQCRRPGFNPCVLKISWRRK